MISPFDQLSVSRDLKMVRTGPPSRSSGPTYRSSGPRGDDGFQMQKRRKKEKDDRRKRRREDEKRAEERDRRRPKGPANTRYPGYPVGWHPSMLNPKPFDGTRSTVAPRHLKPAAQAFFRSYTVVRTETGDVGLFDSDSKMLSNKMLRQLYHRNSRFFPKLPTYKPKAETLAAIKNERRRHHGRQLRTVMVRQVEAAHLRQQEAEKRAATERRLAEEAEARRLRRLESDDETEYDEGEAARFEKDHAELFDDAASDGSGDSRYF